MQNPRLATRYATSLLDLAVERNSVEDTLKDMQLLHSICAQSNDFVLMLRSPVIAGDKKMNVVRLLLEGRGLSPLTQLFVDLMVSKGREIYLPEIVNAFLTQYNELKNIKTVKLSTATTMTDSTISSLKSKISGFLPGSSVELNTLVDETLIGGFVIEMEGKLYDASVRKSLNDFRTKVLDSSYDSKM